MTSAERPPEAASDDRARLLVEDILATPDTLEALIHAYAAPDGGPLSALRAALPADRPLRLILSGMGSSRFAALAFAEHGSVHVELASARALTPSTDTVFVGISNSGRTPEVVAAIRDHRGTSLTVGLTNHPDRAVGEAADLALPLLAGDERSGIASRTYAATVAALALVVGEITGRRDDGSAEDLRAVAVAARDLRDGWASWVAAASDVLDGADEIHVIGDGRAMGSLEQAALMFREAPRLRALPMDAGDWLHVGLYTMLPGGRAILFGGTPYDVEIAATIARRGGRLVAVGPAVNGADHVVPVPDVRGRAARAIVVAGVSELIAAELWCRASRTA